MERQINSTTYPIPFPMFLAGTSTPAPGVSVTLTRRKQGGTFAAIGGSVAGIANGFYEFTPIMGDVDTLGSLMLYATATGCDPTMFEVDIVTHDPFTALTAIKAKTDTIGTGALPVVNAVINSQTLRFTMGDAYKLVDGRQWDFPYSGLSSFVGGSGVTLKITPVDRPTSTVFSITGIVLDSVTLRFEPGSAETGVDTIKLGDRLSNLFAFEIQITLANGNVITPTALEDGRATICAQAM